MPHQLPVAARCLRFPLPRNTRDLRADRSWNNWPPLDLHLADSLPTGSPWSPPTVWVSGQKAGTTPPKKSKPQKWNRWKMPKMVEMDVWLFYLLGATVCIGKMAKASSNWRGLKMCAGKIYSQFEAIACNRACCFRLMFATPIQTLRIKTFSHPQMGLSYFFQEKK